jgi:uncharacterized protein YbjT (DUF2867 family)
MTATVALAGMTGRFRALPALLLERGHDVRVITRDPDTELARRLLTHGAQIARGDFDEPARLARALRGAQTVIVGGTAHRAGVAGEMRHGLAAADAARTAGVAHLVYLSGSGAGADTGVPILDGKGAVEAHIRALGLPHTIVAPVYFMENLFNPWNVPALHAGLYPSPIDPQRVLQQVAVADVVAFLALVLERGEAMFAKRVEIASDEGNGEQAARVLSRAWHRPLRAQRIDAGALPAGLARLFAHLESAAERVDISALHAAFPEVPWHTLRSWVLERERPATARGEVCA